MNPERQTRLSKFLSLVLRHRPERIGIQLDAQGWTPVDDLLRQAVRHGWTITRADLEDVIARSDKQRFALSDDRQHIRANQGHTVEVELGNQPAEPPEWLFHGTFPGAVGAIRRQGLQKMKRHHVHLSADEQTAVAVGQRRGRPVLLRIASARMHGDGFPFYVTANHVWLTDHVPPEYIEDCWE